MKKTLVILLVTIVITGCTRQSHFINDKEYLKTVKSDFEKVKQFASNRQTELFNVFEKNLSLEEKEALMFLYAYMPLSDLADYDGDFYLKNIRLALKTRETFNWGGQIPEDIFRHFVLPYRVNNENLDTSRAVFYKELSERLHGLELKEAILEVNHWCHEKITYQPTDIRTISPLGVIKSTYGRCGEESTFTVTAMRAAGIPARQCYTPRWAHSDDNHAWVEVWVDGEWHFLGACEPAPDLDIAWFSAPALRAMMVSSNVFGKYSGAEEIIRKEEKYTKVNMLSNYAPVKTIYARVIDENEEIIKDATVEFQLYNYAEFYPIGKKQVDQNGFASLMTGLGDLIIWAYKNNNYAYQKITVEQTDTVILKLQAHTGKEYTDFFDIVPPIEKEPKGVSAEGKEENKKRLKEEDAIRETYASTFMSKKDAENLATKYKFEPLVVWDFIEKSRGNYPEIVDFIEKAAEINNEFTIPVLNAIAPKDLRDGKSEILLSHIKYSFIFTGELPETNRELFVNYILNPRIENEKLISYKAFLQGAFSNDFIENTKKDITYLSNWITKEISIYKDENFYRVPITAKGVYELKKADEYSRDLFFVAACRSFGIPSRLEPATKTPQYYKEKWTDVNFKEVKSDIIKQTGTLKLINSKENNTDLKYRVHFALSKFEDGKYHTLDYGWDTPISEMNEVFELETGNYLLLTGNRQPGGTVLTTMQYFNIEAGIHKEITIKLRKNTESLKPIAKIQLPEKFKDLLENEITIHNDQVNIIGFLDPEKEPTKHTLVDIEKIASSFNKIETNIYLLVNSTDIDESKYKLPAKTIYLLDENFDLLKQISKELNQEMHNYPVFFVIKNGEVYFISKGYTIGIGEQMIKIIQKVQ
ncbi:MAG: transglutaminase-like domain-containing protein [Bacteroidales bacterium]|nr:transglutaminase-like domain-containing protein [Bacteroidales bacterium]